MGSNGKRAGQRIRLTGAFCVFACVLLLLSAGGQVAGEKSEGGCNYSGDERPEYVAGELLVKFKDDASSDTVKNASKDVGAKELKEFKDLGIKHWKLGDDCSVDDAIKKIEKDFKDDLEFVEPNYYYQSAGAIPNDAYRGELWGMHNIGQTDGTKDADIDAMEAWVADKTGSDKVVVAIIDTGIDYNHEDLAANMWKNPGETGTDANGKDKATNGVDDDGNGFKDDVYGWDFCNNDNDPMDDNGHGTHCAGTIGGVGNNGKGVAGVCWSVKLMALKFLDSYGTGSTANAVSAIKYAASFKDQDGKNIVRITSNSWSSSASSKAMETAIKNSGALFVAAAGNGGSSSVVYPAGYSLDNILSVAATDHNDALASFSSYGSSWVDLGAPGVSVYSCFKSGAYRYMNGTSMACPHVSGAAALIMASDGSLTNAQVKAKIMDNVDSKASLSGKCVSGGRLNIARALNAGGLDSDSTAPGTVGSLAAGTNTETTISWTWTATGDDGDTTGTAAYAYDFRYVEGDTFPVDSWSTATKVLGEPLPRASGSSETFTLTGLWHGKTYTARVRAGDEVGNWGGLSSEVKGTTKSVGYSYDIDSSIDPSTGVVYHSLAIDKNGYPGIGYGDSDNDDLKYAHWNGESWDVETVDTASRSYSAPDLAYWNGNPGISYGIEQLKYAEWNGQSWDIKTIEKRFVGEFSSLAYDGQGNPSIAYSTHQGLKYASRSSGVWTLETVSQSAYKSYKSLAFDGSGNPSIAYSGDLDKDGWFDAVMFAKKSGGTWTIQRVDEGGPKGTGTFVSLAYDGNGNPHIVSRRMTTDPDYNVVFYSWDGTKWNMATICNLRNPEGFSLAYNSSGVPYISFGASDPGRIKVGYKGNGEWTFEDVDSRPSCYSPLTSIAIDSYGQVSLTYVPGSYLRYAERTTG